ncbi:DUF3515 family protein [Longispora sp. K20-0274]|uniref:DUF3515 family protein n=1 Tax=Longispora sp. K20-0274 TaxID=3088255 RepID=UPI00399C3601
MTLVVGIAALWFVNSKAAPEETKPVPTSGVAVPGAPLAEADVPRCRALVAGLPDVVGELPRRAVVGNTEQTAAYGSPAITLACGGPATTFPPTGTLFPINGVCWYGEQATGANVFRTVDRVTPVVVSIPTSYQGQLIAGFSSSVAAAVPAVAEPPAACKN